MSDADDDAILEAGRALERAYADHAAACVLYARQLSPHAAEDAAQEAFVKLMRRMVSGDPPANVRAWLLTAVRSAALDGRRGEGRRRRREQAVATPLFAEAATDGLDATAVADALADLSPRRREVLVLRLWCDLGFAEVAELVGVAVSTAHADYAAALDALRRRFGESTGE